MMALALLGFLSTVSLPSSAVAQSFGPTRQSQLPQVDGCGCGATDVQISPDKLVTTIAGRPVTIRYDASQICRGQSVRNFSGSADWETGGRTALPDTYGFATYVYQQSGSYSRTVTLNIQATCYDTGAKGCSQVCKASGKVPVNVAPATDSQLAEVRRNGGTDPALKGAVEKK